MPNSPVPQLLTQALAHHRAGRLADAERLYREILAHEPQHADALHHLGIVAQQTGHSAAAAALIEQALAARPAFPEALNNLAISLTSLGRLPDAVDAYRRATALNPRAPYIRYNLGLLLHRLNQYDEAASAFRETIALQPDHAQAHAELGNALIALHRPVEGIEAYQRAIALKPDFAAAYVNLGSALVAQGNLDAAATAFRQAAALQPALPEAWINLAGVLMQTGQAAAAVDCYRKALAANPHRADIHSLLIHALNYHPGIDPATLTRELSQWNQRHAAHLASRDAWPTHDRTPQRRLRIGYVSSDFWEHAIAYFFVPTIEHHDPANVEVYCYSNVARPDGVTERIRRRAHAWRDITTLSDDHAAAQIRADGIDILVDLQLHTDRNRLLIFARKPAPVQVSWLGYPGSTGLTTIDYRLTDPYLDPPGTAADSSEAVWRLPHTFWCYDPQIEEPPVNPLPALSAGHITFGCLNMFGKVNDAVLQLWARVLNQVRHSRLILLASEGSHRQRTVDFLSSQGVTPERIEFVARMPRFRYLHVYHRIDISLDTFPYNGHTTGIDSLWMGVPFVTLAGNTAPGRAGVSQLMNVGLPALIAHDPDAFVAHAAVLADNVRALAALRGSLRHMLRSSPLMGRALSARHLEAAYRAFWHAWCGKQLPIHR